MLKYMVALTLALSGCASVGNDYSAASIDALRAGMSQADVVTMLGQPNTRTTLADGTEQWMWVHAKANAFGSAHSKAVMLKFGPDKKFVEVMSSTETVVR